ncbi:hypothetical protein L9G74_18870 [Shewanella sp. C32]|uniref:Uncharacterized protein n=1 Tax=Shewanella electrica TaxID=515560 RepID=A0ABT2FQA0_9GAMM|nr:hypothetical protein [Shewanella electrica]MCH1926908.1 hypothetical protein [Shewanella electrica]MCS4558502.1 hypothetical protein [Shewanella electrica]
MKHPTAETFLKDVANHKLHVLHDDGVYRHLVLSSGSFECRFEIITWPNNLCINGDMGSYVFSRCQDMFQFFRREELGINAGYWSEKVEAECRWDGIKEFDITKVHERLDYYLECFKEDLDADNEEEAEAIAAATEAVSDFKDHCEHSEWDAVSRINNWDEDDAGGMDLDDFWDGGFDTFTYRYIWCCYAIVWAIQQYDALEHKEAA